jgi:hypothetical protein
MLKHRIRHLIHRLVRNNDLLAAYVIAGETIWA